RDWAAAAIEGWERWDPDGRRSLFHRTGFANLSLEPLTDEGFIGRSLAGLPSATRLDAVAIADRFPFLSPGFFVDGYLNPAVGWADAGATVRFQERKCQLAGVGIVPERAARVGDGWVGLEGDGLLRAGCVVVAAGAWTTELVAQAPLAAVGQPVLYLRPTTPERFAEVPVWGLDLPVTGYYGFPATADGIVKVGHHGPGVTRRLRIRTVPDAVVETFRGFFREAIPELAGAPIAKTRVCFYCDAPDGRFLVDRVPGHERLVVAAGGSGHGFKFAPVIGELIAAVVTDEDHPARMATQWRDAAPGVDAARASAVDDDGKSG
ncbi:MAG: FAD-dependent oxidoreductase, partial [Acidimicrobiia bacterium]|nr:FAD-dependent oxidoreductase [Acidimicrobiia bacterium]